MTTRAFPVLAFLSALLLLPATAGARLHVVAVERGETAIAYEGAGETNIPMGYQCVGTNTCTSFGSIAYTLHWQASVIVNRLGTIHGDDTTLKAGGGISVQPNSGCQRERRRPRRQPATTPCATSETTSAGLASRAREGRSAYRPSCPSAAGG